MIADGLLWKSNVERSDQWSTVPSVQCSVARHSARVMLYSIESGDWSSVLRQVVVPIISQTQCSQPSFYGSYITDNMLCAGYTDGGKDACHGDSGGPLVCKVHDRWWLHGVVSYGSGCAQLRKPGVYTRVTKFVDWIQQHLDMTVSLSRVHPPQG